MVFGLIPVFRAFQLTRSVGSVTRMILSECILAIISTHTLRRERDGNFRRYVVIFYISTHTLRGERDIQWVV